MFVALILTSLVMLLYAAPEVTVVKALHHILVVRPARFLSRLSPAKILFVAALGLAAALLIGLFEAEGAKFFTMMAPDTVMWFAAFDVATITDALIFAVIVSSSVKLKAVVQRARAIFTPACNRVMRLIRRGARDRNAATRTTTARKPCRLDDPDGWPGLVAYAG